MNETAPEIPENFMDFITLDSPMSPAEAIGKLGEFHNVKDSDILNAFMNLRGFESGTVEFCKSMNSGEPCIAMRGTDSEGKYAWSHLINRYSGQPMVRCS